MRWTPLVLVACEREHERLLYSEYLRGQGFKVLQASDGREVLELAQQFAPDVVSLDLGLPGLDGLTVCERLKEENRTADVHVVAVTTMSYGGFLTLARSLGADRILTKPCPPARLATEIADLLGWPGGYRNEQGRWCRGEDHRQDDEDDS
jgi:CheY-like chemotaxis protein